MASGLEAISNGELRAWLEDVKRLCKPVDVHVCDGSADEYKQMCDDLVKHGTFTPLNETLRPNCFLARSHPSDVARVEDRTYICDPRADRGRSHQQLGRLG